MKNYSTFHYLRCIAIQCIIFFILIAFGLLFSCSKSLAIDETDLVPPAEITELSSIPADGQITLRWIDPTDADFEYVEITFISGDSAMNVEQGVQVATITHLTNGASYVFALRTVDHSGNKSAGVFCRPTIPVAVNPDDTIPPAEVSEVLATVGDAQILLTWIDPHDTDFNKVEITSDTASDFLIEVGRGVQRATISSLNNDEAYFFTLHSVDNSGNKSEGIRVGPFTPVASPAPVVYMTRNISSDGLMAVFQALGRAPASGQKTAVKISTGEGTNSNHLAPSLIAGLVSTVNGDIVECNTAYGGNRASTALHYQIAADRGYTAIATVVIMDERGTTDIPVANGKHLQINRVGARFNDYQFHVVLSHFKGHAMAGYGGALKNMSIGYASSAGKSHIHSGGNSWSGFYGDQNSFLESMAEAAKSIVDYAGQDNFIYINVMNRLSVDCDCSAHPAAPTMADIGILASLDPVALDKACLDLVDAAPDGVDLRNRIARQNGKLTNTHAAEIGLGSLEYELLIID